MATEEMIITKVKLNQIHSKLDWLLKRNERIFAEAVRRWFDFTVKQIQTDLRTKFQKDVTSELTDWEYLQNQGQDILKPATLSVVQTGGGEAYKLFQVKGAFDVLNPEAIKAANKFTAELVREVNGQTKKGIRTYISTGIKEGKSMDKIARELRPLVGLTKNQTQSIINYKTLLQDKEKFPKLAAADIDKKVQRYADKTHRRRAQMIARTETAHAQNLGYVQGMEDLGVEQLEFSAYPGCCDECQDLDKTKYKVEEAGGIIPVHPNCRCAMLPVVAGGTIHTPQQMTEAKPAHIKNLVDTAETNKDVNTLRTLEYKGGLKGKPPIVRPVVVKPEIVTDKTIKLRNELKTIRLRNRKLNESIIRTKKNTVAMKRKLVQAEKINEVQTKEITGLKKEITKEKKALRQANKRIDRLDEALTESYRTARFKHKGNK